MSAVYLQNKYTHWYYSIIDRARSRPVLGYIEKHHIIPRSLGGSNNKDNLVALTAREHFVCHLLLTRMTTGEARKKMVFSVFYLTGRGKAGRNNILRRSHHYEKLKQDLSIIVGEQKKGCTQPPRSLLARQRYSDSKKGQRNPNHKGFYITPWGEYPSSRSAAKACPTRISDVAIINFCTTKNLIPVSYLSVCRSKGYLNDEHIGLTPQQLGFSFKPISQIHK